MKIQKRLGAAVMSLGLVIGLSGFAGATTGTIDTTGPDSDNTIHSEWSQRVDVHNDNKVDLDNDNDQDAWTGDADVEGNTNAGDADTGNANNANALTGNVTIDNSGSVPSGSVGGSGGGNHTATIRDTGPDSDNHVTFETKSKVEIDNDNNVYIDNNNEQDASSGDATVENNTNGGSASTGNASNTNTSSFTIRISN